MIQANDLRIGNIVYDGEGEESIITSIHKSSVRTDNSNAWAIEIIKPVILIEPYLFKYGFKRFSHDPGYSIGCEVKDEVCNEYTLGKITLMNWGMGYILSNSFSFDLRVKIKYLHQLQNLYFALTGEELTIPLT